MAILALVQRASIISFQNFATLLTNGLEKDNKKIEQVTINNLLNYTIYNLTRTNKTAYKHSII